MIEPLKNKLTEVEGVVENELAELSFEKSELHKRFTEIKSFADYDSLKDRMLRGDEDAISDWVKVNDELKDIFDSLLLIDEIVERYNFPDTPRKNETEMDFPKFSPFEGEVMEF